MATRVELRNERTGEIKSIKVGWSWILFLFSGFLGLPLFLRGLHAWGGIMLALWLANLVGPDLMSDDESSLGLLLVLGLVGVGLAVFLGVKGNELTAKNYLENGWEFADPGDRSTQYAKGKWALA